MFLGRWLPEPRVGMGVSSWGVLDWLCGTNQFRNLFGRFSKFVSLYIIRLSTVRGTTRG